MNADRAVEETPFWERRPPRTSRRGEFWIPGERVDRDGATYQRAPMFVAWEAPAQPSRRPPVVLVHGGTLQGTQWGDTPDGRPGGGPGGRRRAGGMPGGARGAAMAHGR